MSRGTNIEAQERLGELIGAGELERLDQVFAEEVVDHDPSPGQGPGPEGFRQFFTEMRTAFPDLSVQVDELVADDDHVSIASTIGGTHNGERQGVAPTGKRVQTRGMQIARLEDGKIVERWGASDELGMLRQLGAA